MVGLAGVTAMELKAFTTVTVKLPELLLLAVSVAVTVTVVVPIGKVLPLAGLLVTDATPLVASVAVGVKVTTAPAGDVALSVMLVGTVSVGAVLSSLTVTEWSPSTFPALSRAWKVTVVTPSVDMRIEVELAATEPPPVCAPVNVYVMDWTPLPPALSVAVRVTVTFELFQPAPLADGAAVAAEVGAIVSVTTVNVSPLLADPLTVTTTGPVVVPAGTVATIWVSLQPETEAVTPLNVTMLVPCVAPKLEPEIVTEVPTNPDVGEIVLITGALETHIAVEYSSAEAGPGDGPPATSTWPVGKRTTPCCDRANVMLPVPAQAPVAGSYSSAELRLPLLPDPPATSTLPLGKSAAGATSIRALAIEPVRVHIPVAGS